MVVSCHLLHHSPGGGDAGHCYILLLRVPAALQDPLHLDDVGLCRLPGHDRAAVPRVSILLVTQL